VIALRAIGDVVGTSTSTSGIPLSQSFVRHSEVDAGLRTASGRVSSAFDTLPQTLHAPCRRHAQRCGATIIANFEIACYFEEKGLKTHGMAQGGGHDFPFGRVKFVPAIHSSSLPGPGGVPIYLGNPAGLVLTIDGRNLYHAGDTALFSDMALISRRTALDLALLPIGDNFTMGIEDAVEAIKLLQPRRVVPIHYNTWDLIHADTDVFAARVRAETKAEPVVLAPGAAVEF
jgi:L-ascorbate metabolism protein UlaG (beta-lactamase superfamily)